MTDKVQKIRKEVERMHELLPVMDGDNISINYADRICRTLEMYIDSLQEEPVSNDLEAAAKNVGQKYFPDEDNIWARPNYEAVKAECAFMDGTMWQKASLWKPADGDDLPKIDKEVIVLVGIKNPVTTDSVWGCEVAFAHRPNPDGWNGKSITTGKVEHYEAQTYGKGGWNIPDVKFWLDCELPKMEE